MLSIRMGISSLNEAKWNPGLLPNPEFRCAASAEYGETFMTSARDSQELIKSLPAIPADLEIARIFFSAAAAVNDAAISGRGIVGPYDFASPREISIIDQPDFRIHVGKRQLAQASLCVLVEYPRFNTSIPQQIKHDVGIGKARGAVDSLHSAGLLQ